MKFYPVVRRNYQPIDPIISSWAEDNSLDLISQYQGEEVRSFYFVDDEGDVRFQIWIDPLAEDGSIEVHVWEIKKGISERRQTEPIDLIALSYNLREKLTEALKFVRIEES